MKFRLVDLLRCPLCSAELQVRPLHSKTELHNPVPLGQVHCQKRCARMNKVVEKHAELDCSTCFAEDIIEGSLCCRNGHLFPITAGVPRMIAETTSAIARTSKSFGKEWALFRHGKDRTWGWDREARRARVLLETDMQPAQFNGTTIMDAGCGNGVVAASLGDMGAEVIGIDISSSVNAAFVYNKNPHVHYVQGDLMNPPIRKYSLDLIYSSGVLHHTRNTELALSCLAPLLRPGGRFYVWLYHPQTNLKHQIMIALRRVVSRMPPPVQNMIATLLTGCAVMKRRVLGITDKPPLNWREQKINFYDGLTPPYRFEHTQDEVRRWFVKRGFADARCTIEEEFGFGMYADWKPDLSDERS